MLLLLKQSAPIGIIAMGMTIVMINGNIDLSVGAIFALRGDRPARQHDLAGLRGAGRLGDPGRLAAGAGGRHGCWARSTG